MKSFLAILLLCTFTQAMSKPQLVYFGTYTQGNSNSEGIYVSRFNSESGHLSEPQLAATVSNPSFLAVHPERPLLFAALEGQDFTGEDGAGVGGVAAYTIDPATGKLSHLNTQPTGGAHPCHISIDKTGRFVLVANYTGGNVASFQIREDGSLSEAISIRQHEGSSVHPERQKGPHAHSIYPSPVKGTVYAVDLGIDQILRYGLDGEGALHLKGTTELSSGSGPRHMAFHPSGRFAFSINELTNSITAYSINAADGELEILGRSSTLPTDFVGRNSTAEIAVHPSGRFLYGSNRGHDSIVVFEIDPESGALHHLQHFKIKGTMPRNFRITPGGNHLLVAGQRSHSIEVLEIDPANGTLRSAGSQIELPSPVCVVFAGSEPAN